MRYPSFDTAMMLCNYDAYFLSVSLSTFVSLHLHGNALSKLTFVCLLSHLFLGTSF